MNLSDAFKIIGLNPELYFSRLASSNLSDKLIHATKLKEYVVKNTKKWLASHHPDKGGDIVKFRTVDSAIKKITEDTEIYISKLQSKIEDLNKPENSRVLITIK